LAGERNGVFYMNLNKLFETFPWLQSILSFLETWGGGIVAGGFFMLMAYIFYWILVIVPKGAKKVYADLATKGYSKVALPSLEIEKVFKTLAPIFPKAPKRGEPIPPWNIVNSAMRKKTYLKQFVFNGRRGQKTSPKKLVNVDTTIVVERCRLDFSEDIHLYPRANSTAGYWTHGFDLLEVTTEFDPVFLESYRMFSNSGKIDSFPDALKTALLTFYPTLSDRSFTPFQNGVTLRFTQDGWGICTSFQIYKSDQMSELMIIVSNLSKALGN
jgi:hypothetical protein